VPSPIQFQLVWIIAKRGFQLIEISAMCALAAVPHFSIKNESTDWCKARGSQSPSTTWRKGRRQTPYAVPVLCAKGESSYPPSHTDDLPATVAPANLPSGFRG
jgi:hypothetical protein